MAHDVSIGRFWGNGTSLMSHRVPPCFTVADVLEVLRLSNKTKLAAEMTRRGYEVDGETLSRWVRTNYEVPEKAARYIREIFGIQKSGLPSEDDRPLMRSDVVEILDAMARSGALDATARALVDAVLAALGQPPHASPTLGTQKN